MRLLFASALGLLLAAPARATKPCGPDSWYAKPDRPAAEWAAQSSWIAVARVTSREEHTVPFENCYLKDRSGCAMDDRSIVVVSVKRWEKGGPLKIKRLGKSYCGPTAPAKAGGTYRFYGVGPDAYIYYEKVAR